MIYPLLTWVVSWPAFTVTVLANGVTEVLNVPDGAAYGWKTTGTDLGGVYAADAASLAKVLVDALNTHSELGSATAFYGTTSADIIGGLSASGTATGIYLSDTGGAVITVTSNAAALALFGLQAGDDLGAECIIARRTAGVWRHTFAPPATLEPVLVAIGSGAISEYNAGAFNRLLFGGRLVWSVKWEFVQAADITRSLAPLNDYLPGANRAPGDTAGTLDDALWALASGLTWTLALPPEGTAAISYREVIMDVSGSIDRGAYTTEAAVGARLYHVTLTTIETTDFDPGTAL